MFRTHPYNLSVESCCKIKWVIQYDYQM